MVQKFNNPPYEHLTMLIRGIVYFRFFLGCRMSADLLLGLEVFNVPLPLEIGALFLPR